MSREPTLRAGEERRVAQLPDGPLPYVLRRSARARGLRVTVHPVRGVVVSVPTSRRPGWADPVEAVERFLAQREAWIRGHLRRQAARRARLATRPALDAGRIIPFRGRPHRITVTVDPAARRSSVASNGIASTIEIALATSERRSPGWILERWLREEARKAIEQAIARHAPTLRVEPSAVTLRDPRTRWGSCSRRGRVSLSWRLILAPPAALETVVVHELCHLRVFGHGPRFRALLNEAVADNAEWRRWLRIHADDLHGALDESEDVGQAA